MKMSESQNQETMNAEFRKPGSDLIIQIRLIIEIKQQGLNKQINEDLNKTVEHNWEIYQ